MLNQIRFKLFDENHKFVGYEEWCIGEFNIEHKKDYYVLDPGWRYSKDGITWTRGFIDHRFKSWALILDNETR